MENGTNDMDDFQKRGRHSHVTVTVAVTFVRGENRPLHAIIPSINFDAYS